MGEADGGARRHRRAVRVGRTGARFPRVVEETAEPAPEIPADIPPEIHPETRQEPGDVLVGRTGARFGSHARRARREAERAAAEGAEDAEDAEDTQDAEDTEVPAPARAAGADVEPEPGPDDAPTGPLFLPSPPAESTRTRVRPYVRTRGRTRTRTDLAVETLVSIPSPRPPLEDPEHVALGDVVEAPRSVAEVAALLGVPLGVVRVIIDDMAGAGLLLVHPRAVAATGAPSQAMMRRVLDGLHRL